MACLLLHRVLLLHELKLFVTEEEWEELITRSISQVTEVTSSSMFEEQMTLNGSCSHLSGAWSQSCSLGPGSAYVVLETLCLMAPALSSAYQAVRILVTPL